MRDISVTVSRHDKYQVELKFICPMQEEKKDGSYHFELFFFLPRNLAVSSENYDSRDFYNDFSEYIRFQTPQVSLEELASGEHNAFLRLKNSDPDNIDEYGKSLKMFCSIVKSALRDSSAVISGMDEVSQLLATRKFLADGQSLLRNFRQLSPEGKKYPESSELFDLADEFISLTVHRYIFRLWRTSGAAADPRMHAEIAAVTGQEMEYRAKKNFLSLPQMDSNNSQLVYRESALKKAMAGVLFLNVETRKAGVLLENILMGAGAAVAMIFVTAISFIWAGLLFDQFSLSFFVIWVIAYIFKDRIKAGMQNYFLRHRSRYSYDFQQKIRDGLGNDVGMCREGFLYCSEAELDKKIVKLRDRRTLSRLENASLKDNVMVFRKRIELSGRGCSDIHREFDVNGVVDILRISTRHWTYKMDNPHRMVYISDGQKISAVKANRDYHVNLIIRYGRKGGEDKFQRFRLILCRDGIRKLEKVTVPGFDQP